jgi:hypothetical protein
LYAHLVERFEHDPNVNVILDRRVMERRVAASAVPGDRRRSDRRRAVSSEDDLRTRSHYIVEL